MVRRSAFTLIELIFAIVVMAIVMLSFPIIMQVDSDAREKNIAQEAVFAASAKLAQVLTFQWDEASLSWAELAENHQTWAYLVDGTDYNTTIFDRNASNVRPSGSVHRTFFPTLTNATRIGDDNTTLDAFGNQIVVGIDDRNRTASALSGFEAGFTKNSEGYKRDYRIQVDILRVNDALSLGGGTVDYNSSNLTGSNGFVFSQNDIHNDPTLNPDDQTNLRCARVTIQNDSGDPITILYGYAANIGEYKVYSKVRP